MFKCFDSELLKDKILFDFQEVFGLIAVKGSLR